MFGFTHIIFDLDGTLTDNTRGISNSVKYALKKMYIDGFSDENLKQFIGPPLQWGFSNLFGLNEQNTELAVEYFREYYGENGWHENVPYPGILEMLQELDHAGRKMYIATSKLEKYANKISEYFGFNKHIIQLSGADYSGKKASKSMIISALLETQKLTPSTKIVMVGDTVFDIEGGNNNGLSTIAVGYGFGEKEELIAAKPNYYAENVEELFEILSL
jgi:phosphoglycolate phosphatase